MNEKDFNNVIDEVSRRYKWLDVKKDNYGIVHISRNGVEWLSLHLMRDGTIFVSHTDKYNVSESGRSYQAFEILTGGDTIRYDWDNGGIDLIRDGVEIVNFVL